MADTHNVFISWSGERSRLAAEALREWLSNVLQNARPWMSTEMEKGSRSFEEIARALEGMKVGIICLTPENLTSEWFHYEAGALSKTADAKTRVCTYLLADLDATTVKPPLSWFQWTKANKVDTRKLVGTINQHLDAAPLSESTLNATFEKWWPDLDEKLKALPAPSSAPPPRRSSDEMVAEILEHTRMMIPVIGELSEEASFSRNKRKQDAALSEWISKQPGGVVISGSNTAGPLSAWVTVASETGKVASYRDLMIQDQPAAPHEQGTPTAPPVGQPDTVSGSQSSPPKKKMHVPARNRR